MADYPNNEKSTGLDVLTTLAPTDLVIVGDVSDNGKAKAIEAQDAISDVGLFTTDNTTNDTSTSKHGFAPKLSNDDTEYLDGQGNWTVPPGSSTSNASTTVKGIVQEATQTEVNNGTQTGSTGAELFVNPSTLLQWAQDQGISTFDSYTAEENLTQSDMLYPSSALAVKKIKPDGFISQTAETTDPTDNTTGQIAIDLGNGYHLFLSGGDINNQYSYNLYAQVRLINSTETDFSQGTAQTVNGSNLVGGYNACLISPNKVFVIYECFSGASTPAGVYCRVISISGTTITLGTEKNIDATGANKVKPSVAKLDTDKVLITYQTSSGASIMVLTVSGTTISAVNTPVTLTTDTQTWVQSIQLATDTALIVYSNYGASTALLAQVATISGTTPTLGGSQTLNATNDAYYTNLGFVSDTEVMMSWNRSASGSGTNIFFAKLTISGSTVSKGTDLTITSNANNQSPGMHCVYIISAFIALVTRTTNNTGSISNATFSTSIYDISGAIPVLIASETFTSGSIHANNQVFITRLLPWLYVWGSSIGEPFNILALSSTNNLIRFAIARSTVNTNDPVDAGHRFTLQTGLTGLTAGIAYYVDDNAQPTTISSLGAPFLGVPTDTTKIFLS